jgi:LmbE family N-acetylglucosaminyl deacetylase
MRGILPVSVLVFTALSATPATQDRPRTLVALLAHADDESMVSPVLARYAREGVQVHLVIATDGSGGTGSQTYLGRSETGPVGDELAKARAEEAQCAANALGVREPRLLAFPDGKLGDYLGDRTLLLRLTEQIAKDIERLRPDAVVTWGPDGGTGHPDHRIVSNIATQLLRAGAPGMPDRLFYMYVPVELFRLMNPQRGEPPLLFPQAKHFTIQVPFTPADLEVAAKARACHRSQFNAAALAAMAELGRLWNGRIALIPASSSMTGDDLFRPVQTGAPTVQYKSPAGVEYRSLPETEAITKAQAALAADPRSVARLIDLGVAQSGARQFREAIATFTRGLQIEPDNALLLRWRGHRYLSVREFDRALADLRRGARIDSTIYGIWYHLGIVQFVRGEFAAAAASFAKAQPIAPDAAELAGSTDWLWMSLSRAGRGAEAKAMLDRRPDTHPQPVTNAYTRRLQLYRGEIGPQAVLTPADTDEVQVATLAFGIGNWYLVRGDKAQARVWFERSVKSGGWPGFGFILSEVELRRLR